MLFSLSQTPRLKAVLEKVPTRKYFFAENYGKPITRHGEPCVVPQQCSVMSKTRECLKANGI